MKINKKIWLLAVVYFTAGFLITYLESLCNVFGLHDILLCRVASLFSPLAGALVLVANLTVLGVAFLISLFSRSLRRTALIMCLLTAILTVLIFASHAIFVRFVSPSSFSEPLKEGNCQITRAPVVDPILNHPPEFFSYLQELQSHIKKNWSWEEKDFVLVTKVFIEIEPDGAANSVSIQMGSGNSKFDQAVLIAIRNASPFPAPPSAVYERFKTVVLTIDSRE